MKFWKILIALICLGILAVSGSGCTVSTYEDPAQRKLFTGTLFQDRKIGEIDAERRPDGSESFHLKSLDQRARLELIRELLNAAP